VFPLCIWRTAGAAVQKFGPLVQVVGSRVQNRISISSLEIIEMHAFGTRETKCLQRLKVDLMSRTPVSILYNEGIEGVLYCLCFGIDLSVDQ